MQGLERAFERVGEAVEAYLPLTHAAGAALAVTDGDDTLGAVVRGFADVASGRPVGPDTRFQIGSISKSFASLCVLQEEAKGTLVLDVSINELVPGLDLPEPFGPITLHHLLTHTSGLRIGVEHGPWSHVERVRAKELPPTFPPGERFWYSNLGYKLVGFALEHATGTQIHDLLVERVLGPLGMSRSSAAIVEVERTEAAVGYEPLQGDRPAHLGHPLAPAVWQPSNTADGSIVSTATDMCAYARLVLNGGSGPHGELLDAAGFARWIGPHVDSDERGSRYGYGWDVLQRDGRRVVRHTGGMVGFTALLEIWPDDGLGMVVLLNGQGVKDELGREALSSVAAATRGEDLPAFVPPPAPDQVPDAQAYAGAYRSDERLWELDVQDGGLVLRAGPLAVRLERFGEDAFAVPHPALDKHVLRPVRDGAGTVIALTHGPAWLAREGAEQPPEPSPVPGKWAAFPGLYRSNDPWQPTSRVYLRRGRLIWASPSDGSEQSLVPLDGGWFGAEEPWMPLRVRFDDVVEGRAITLDVNGARLYRSFED
ncbi:MAG: serine hydrolase domain-containing protein [Planctomycetaceae bacterium]